MVADIEELEEMDASELHARRLNAKEVLTPQRSGNFIFPFADGKIKIFGRDKRLRTSTLIRDRPERREEQEVLRGESDGLSSPNPLQDDSTRDDAEAKHDIWSITEDFIYRHHVEPRVKLYVPREESFPILLKYIDVTRNTHASMDVFFGRIDDYWNVDGEKRIIRCTDRLLKIRSTEGKANGRINMVQEGDLRGNKQPLVLMMCGQVCGHSCPMQRKRKQNKDGLSRNRSSTMPDN